MARGYAVRVSVTLWESEVQRKNMSADDRTFHSTTSSAGISMEAQRERNIIKRLRRDIYLEYIIKKYLEAACDNCFQIFTETSFV